MIAPPYCVSGHIMPSMISLLSATKTETNMAIRHCLLRCASGIAHYRTLKMVLRSVIFSTSKSGKIVHNYISNVHLKHTWIFWDVLFVAQIFLKDMACYTGNCDARSSKMSLKSKYMIFVFLWHFLSGYCLGFNLVKPPQRLGNWFQRYKELKDWTNDKKRKNYRLCLAVP